MRSVMIILALMTLGEAYAQPQSFQDCPTCPEMVVIPPGAFLMGSTDAETTAEKEPPQYAAWEHPQHKVTINYSFAAGRTEVTKAQYAAFIAATGERKGQGCAVWDFAAMKWDQSDARGWRDVGTTDQHPVACIDWTDVKAYVAWLAMNTGKPYRLLTEAEWEYAARAGTTTYRYWGDDKNDGCGYANVYDLDALKGLNQNPPNPDRYSSCNDGHVRSAPVGSFKPNAFGLHDMLGNVFEWLEDCFHENYNGAPTDGSAWVSGACEQRAARGGSWSSAPRNLRSAWRERDRPDFRYDGIGFRVGLTMPSQEKK